MCALRLVAVEIVGIYRFANVTWAATDQDRNGSVLAYAHAIGTKPTFEIASAGLSHLPVTPELEAARFMLSRSPRT